VRIARALSLNVNKKKKKSLIWLNINVRGGKKEATMQKGGHLPSLVVGPAIMAQVHLLQRGLSGMKKTGVYEATQIKKNAFVDWSHANKQINKIKKHLKKNKY
jgi:hypothetical protein